MVDISYRIETCNDIPAKIFCENAIGFGLVHEWSYLRGIVLVRDPQQHPVMVKLNIPYGQVTCGRDQFPIIVVRGIAKGIIVGILLSDCLKELHFVVIAVLCKCLYGLVRVDIITVEGDILYILRIPSIDSENPVREGVSMGVLEDALGHEEDTAYIGAKGNCVIAGHRNYNFGQFFNRLDEVEIIGVPNTLMRTLYEFSTDWAIDANAKQINMMLIDPMAVITPISYTFSKLDPPAAMSEGKWVYYEESFEDVFVLENKSNAIQFNITASA